MTEQPQDTAMEQPARADHFHQLRHESCFALASRLSTCVLALALAACAGNLAQEPALPSFDTSPVPIADPGTSLPDGWMFNGFLQVYVRGYQDSDGDGIGDLRGLIQRLDYIRDLGVGGIWLMPVMQSQDRDHGYAVTNYRDIESDYGTLRDFDELVEKAHERGLGIIIDYVMNHSAARHPAFINSSAASGNAFRDWYIWQSRHPRGWSIGGNDPWHQSKTGWYYSGFWSQMPDFNMRSEAAVAWHQDNLRFWLNRGVDGLRFDAVGNLYENGPEAWENQPENYPLLGRVRALVSRYENRYMVCESPADPLGFAAQSVCGSAFAFKHNTTIIRAARGDVLAVQAIAEYPKSVPASMATILSNHDSFAGRRIWDQLEGNTAQYRLAAATYLLQPGIPFIYYGEEIGMAGAANLTGDPQLRTPMSWTGDPLRAGFTTGTPFRELAANVASHNVAAQMTDADSLLIFYKAMLGLRRNRHSLKQGSYEGVVTSSATLSSLRTSEDEQTLVVLNYGISNQELTLQNLTPLARYSLVWPAREVTIIANNDGRADITAMAQEVAVFARVD